MIGNSASKGQPLRNPMNDGRAMARTLREPGFTVLARENTSKRTMEAAVIEFGRRLTRGGAGFFYYAGHGLHVRGHNYLVPVDAEIESEAKTRVATVDVNLLREQMAVPSGSWGGRRPSLTDYVTVTGATDGATAAGRR